MAMRRLADRIRLRTQGFSKF